MADSMGQGPAIERREDRGPCNAVGTWEKDRTIRLKDRGLFLAWPMAARQGNK